MAFLNSPPTLWAEKFDGQFLCMSSEADFLSDDPTVTDTLQLEEPWT